MKTGLLFYVHFFVYIVVLYYTSVLIPAKLYAILSIICMGLWVVLAAYIAQKAGQIFKANTTLTSLITGVTVGLNAYYLNIVVSLCSIVAIVLINIIAFKVVRNKNKK